jgi:hypothetical protein
MYGLDTQSGEELVANRKQPANFHIGVFIYDCDEGHPNPTGDACFVHDLQF